MVEDARTGPGGGAGRQMILPCLLKLSVGLGRRLLGSFDMTCILLRLWAHESGLGKFRGQMLELSPPAWLQNKERQLATLAREPAVLSLITRQQCLFSLGQERAWWSYKEWPHPRAFAARDSVTFEVEAGGVPIRYKGWGCTGVLSDNLGEGLCLSLGSCRKMFPEGKICRTQENVPFEDSYTG